ncbi:hypothetical protein CB0940_01320 [Cercospora beticola]|uniref:Uncharacterized protein n=1 Tax=Cercospora beticola TaxID=122368 RepID=A0A2G5I9Y6_CERBT|nr:hypothetical protein CB0940_01320 [Cercospora beticola]PIB01293.1 hypothetical protein CB0940_01320 [Cercospora beticola]WPA96755.1 hypothetical protein RHO25_001363 [Cercospora beticola]
MARRSGRIVPSGNAGNQHKRALSGSTSGETLAKRPKQAKSTPTRSKHFTAPDKDTEDDQSEPEDSASNNEDSGSDFGETPNVDESSGADDDEENESDDDDEDSPRPARGSAKSTPAKNKAGAVWKPGVKTGLGPGTQVIIKKPKARPAGKIPYNDDTIHPNTLLFLSELKENNKREWLKLHDPDFRQSEKDWHSFVEKMTETLTTIDDTIPELPIKDVIFRIYRDVRFSKDPTPYKVRFIPRNIAARHGSALLGEFPASRYSCIISLTLNRSRAGRKGPYAHYYVQCAPNKSFVGGGLWHPEAAPVAAMRRAIDRHPRHLKDVLSNPLIRKEFLKNAPANDKAVVKAFVDSNRGNMLKTKPKGYDSEHPDIDLLRLRNYTIGRDLTDEEVLGENGRLRIADLLAAMQPFITYLNSVVMPDGDADDSTENGESSSEEEEGQEEDGESGDD